MRDGRDTEPSRLLAWAVFLIGVLVPFAAMAFQMFVAGLRNAPLFGTASSPATEPYASNPGLWVTAVLLSGATALLAWLVVVEAQHRKVLVTGLLLGMPAGLAAWFNWWVLSS